MGNKLKDYKKSTVNFFGFEFETKTFWTTMAITVGTLVLLLALTLFGLNISWYGIMVGLGFLSALALCGQLCRERDLDYEYPYKLIWWIFPFSLIGARIYFLIFNGMDSFWDIIRIWDGGLAIYGGVIGGFIGLIICSIINKKSIIKTTDVVVPVLALGQAFGRIGCIFGKCCYGNLVTSKALQWFPIAIKVHGEYHYATNFYESLLNLGSFFGLTVLLRKINIKGFNTCAYLVGYGLIRFILEMFRAEEQTLYIGSYPVSQLLSLILLIGGTIGITTLLIVNHQKRQKETNNE
jgi:phosphatidylglycerol:prolipoprotein diacylglycerol transferase